MRARLLFLLTLLSVAAAASPAAAQRSAERSERAWQQQSGRPAASHNGAPREVQARRYRAFKLDRRAMQAVLDETPRERTRRAPLEVSLPDPDGGFSRFALVRTQMMEPELAARHPEIATYAATGIDEPGATARISLTRLGLQASVRSAGGDWYVDPYYKGSEALYATYRGDDLENTHGKLVEREGIVPAGGMENPLAPPTLDGPAVSLRQYRLAFLTDPSYATYHGAANVTSAKVALINRVNQIYEDDFGIRLVLVANNDLLNFNTAAMMTGSGGPCGGRACFTSAQAAGCDGPTLDRTHTVIGQIIGAANYDVGHLGLGLNGGGLAYLGVAGKYLKGGGCTGVPTPTGDFFAVDYVAHELGHQFAGNHTFNGTDGSCGGNIAATAVEPGSGSSVMAYAGICGADDLQTNTDPYFSQQTLAEVGAHTRANFGLQAEYQTVALTGFGSGDSFTLSHNGNTTSTISTYTANAIESALEALPGLANRIIIYDLDEADGTPSNDGFVVRFSTGVDEPTLGFTGSGVTAQVSETDRGGAAQNGGSTVTTTTNRAPVATVPAAYTIPARTPFALTGAATDADGDALTYSWEQNDPAAGKALLSNTKPNGPLFRQFHTASTAPVNPTSYSPAGQNHAPSTPTRVFPDLAQIAANNTNAATGSCPAGNVECFSEFLPTTAYLQAMHFRLTVRDGNPLGGGVASADTTVNVATGAGPFLVNALPQASYAAGTQAPLTWAVANTNVAPVNAASVRISLSTDGGLTYPHELLASTANDGAETVTLPSVDTTTARIKVEAVGNAFFDITNANFTITPASITATNTVGTVSVDYGDPVTPVKKVSASDADSNGSALSVTAPDLPAGLALTTSATSLDGARPGTRTWDLTGNVTAAPATYPVTAEVTDGTNRAPTAFTVTVTTEDAAVAYTGDTSVSGPQGETVTSVPLEATVSDPDGGAGDLSTAIVRFEKAGAELCSDAADAGGVATCNANLGAGTHQIDVVVEGGRYTGVGSGSVAVSFPAFTATSAAVSVPYSDVPAGTVNASDGDSDGDQLSATATGLPAGVTLVPGAASADAVRPGTRAFNLAGAVTAAPGTYPVTVQVSDGAGHSAQTAFDLTVTREAADVAYTGDPTVSGAQGATTATVPLQATVDDPDASAGDLTTATVTFKKGATTLCGPVAADATGVAGCDATLGAGAHEIDAVVGGRYTGSLADAVVTVSFPAFTISDPADASVQYSDALGTPLTVTATDEDTPGADLQPATTGLPAGLTPVVTATGADSRTWRLDGTVTDAPGTYPVTFTASDPDGHQAQTSFTLTVTREDVQVTDATVSPATGVEGAATSPVTVRAALAQTADGTPGDLATASVTFKKGDATLCTDPAATAAGEAECQAQLAPGTHALTIQAGGRFTGAGTGSVTVEVPVFSAEDSGDATADYSDLPAVTVSASDDNTPGAELEATAAGLPAGLALTVESTGDGLPGTRSWRLTGQALDALGSYPVTVTVADGAGHTTTTAFTVTLTAEDAVPTFTGSAERLSATVAEAADGAPGDLAHATLTFAEGDATLCANLPVTGGGASCTASLGTGTHTVRMLVGGRYTGEGQATVTVAQPEASPTPTPTVAPTPAPTVQPRPAVAVLDLRRIARTVRVKKHRFRVRLACGPAGAVCQGRLTIKLKRTTIATARFSVTGTRTITVKLNARGRKALKRARTLKVKASAGTSSRSFKLRR